MKVLLMGAFGNLGREILRALCAAGHRVIAAGISPQKVPGVEGALYEIRRADLTKPEQLKGLCDGVETVITTAGLTKASTEYSNYDIDYRGNLNLLNEARRAGVAHFAYISVIHADLGAGVPMVNAKYMMEQELIRSGIDYVIYRPTGYFYDIAKVFLPMIEKGSVDLLRVKPEPGCNVVDVEDFARFIVKTMCEHRQCYEVGGAETYTYREIAEMFFAAEKRTPHIRFLPPCVMSLLACLPKIRKSGRRDVILFSKFTLTHDCVGSTVIEGKSFKQYIEKREYAARIAARR